MASFAQDKPPSSILIVGSGVFGLSTALALTQRSRYDGTRITVLDRSSFPPQDASSIDSSRIIRADYANRIYASLASQAQDKWRGEWGAEGRYHENGLILVAEGSQGEEYVRASLKNVRQLNETLRGGESTDGSRSNEDVNSGQDGIEVLETAEDIRRAMHIPPTHEPPTRASSRRTGYINRRSGWADAEACMRYLHNRLLSTPDRVTFVTGTASTLLFDPITDAVLGVKLRDEDDGDTSPPSSSTAASTITADLTVVAAGAWTPSLLDMRGVATATAQVIAYFPLSEAEQADLGRNPTILDLSTGHYAITASGRELKVARHAYGYVNPVSIPNPEREATTSGSLEREKTILVSRPLPRSNPTAVPPAALRSIRSFLRTALPHHAASLCGRAPARTRLCWYTDTPTGDFIVSHHPRHPALFVATAGSGHAFKFLPVIGDKIVDVLERRPDPDTRVYRSLWSWPPEKSGGGAGAAEPFVCTEDGSRGGHRGLLLTDAMGVSGDGGFGEGSKL